MVEHGDIRRLLEEKGEEGNISLADDELLGIAGGAVQGELSCDARFTQVCRECGHRWTAVWRVFPALGSPERSCPACGCQNTGIVDIEWLE